MIPKLLDPENGLRAQVESMHKAVRKTFACPFCGKRGSVTLTSDAGKRRFQCSCNKSWSVCKFLELVQPAPISIPTATIPVPMAVSLNPKRRHFTSRSG